MEYVLGFAFSENSREILLIKKNRPEFQSGLLNGIGGKIEQNENPKLAMAREFVEETGIETNNEDWNFFLKLEYGKSIIYCYSTKINNIYNFKSITDEVVDIYPVEDINYLKIMPNLKWIIPMAVYESDVIYNVCGVEI